MTKKKKEELKEFYITFSITGRGSATIMAKDKEHAMSSFLEFAPENEKIIEWEYGDVIDAEENV